MHSQLHTQVQLQVGIAPTVVGAEQTISSTSSAKNVDNESVNLFPAWYIIIKFGVAAA